MQEENPSDTYDGEIERCLEECIPIIGSGILNADNFKHPFFRPCLTRLAILLADCLKRAKAVHNMECDVQASGRTNRDPKPTIGYLVTEFRNSACHAFSDHRKVSGNYFDWILLGPMAAGIKISGFSNLNMELSNQFHNDILVSTGLMQIYLARDMGGSFNWLADNFTSIPNRFEWREGE